VITIAELVEQAFLAGYRHGVSSFAVWKHGAQLVGTMERPLGEVLKRAPEDCKLEYGIFLEQQKVRNED
jgi:hypothetical protein